MKIDFNAFPDAHPNIELPGSKSISNRFLIIRNLAGSNCQLKGLSNSRDTQLLLNALENPSPQAYFHDGATPSRFFMALAAAKGLQTEITGVAGLYQRNVGALVDVLISLGAEIEYFGNPGFLPVKITKGIERFSEAVVDHSISSQFTSALMLIAPQFPGIKTIHLKGSHQAGFSYIDMTAKCMEMSGISVAVLPDRITIEDGIYRLPAVVQIEADWSSAAWFYMFCACMPGSVFNLSGLKKESIQSDARLPEIYSNLGVKTDFLENGIRISHSGLRPENEPIFDLKYNIDLAPAIISTCAFLGLHATFTGIENLKYKESNRLESLKINLAPFGIYIENQSGTERLIFKESGIQQREMQIRTFDDHRIAMSMAVFALKNNLNIDHPECVEKSFPGFWEKLNFLNIRF